MIVEVLLIANNAAVENGLLHIQGGGWESYRPPLFPATVRGSVAGIVTLSSDELGTTPALSVAITDQEGHVEGASASMIVSGIRPTTVAGVPCRIPFDVPFLTVVRAPTVVKVALLDGGAELAAVTFAVLDSVPDAPPDSN